MQYFDSTATTNKPQSSVSFQALNPELNHFANPSAAMRQPDSHVLNHRALGAAKIAFGCLWWVGAVGHCLHSHMSSPYSPEKKGQKPVLR